MVSVASNVLPAAFRRLCDLARGGKQDDAARWDIQLQQAYEFLGVESNPIPLKAVLVRMGIGHGLRLPLTTLSAAHDARATCVTDQIQKLEYTCRDTVAA